MSDVDRRRAVVGHNGLIIGALAVMGVQVARFIKGHAPQVGLADLGRHVG
ncbi:MAG: hypothetical protein Q7N95_08120 [Alphaproteobacteria bacterium]|nr:hypothetical protein [Alphaproteobacteria bacterium]